MQKQHGGRLPLLWFRAAIVVIAAVISLYTVNVVINAAKMNFIGQIWSSSLTKMNLLKEYSVITDINVGQRCSGK